MKQVLSTTEACAYLGVSDTTLFRYVHLGRLYRVQVKGKNCYYGTELKKFKAKYPHGLPRNNVSPHNKGMRVEPPIVSQSIENLVNKWIGSEDQKTYQRRYCRK